MRKKVTNGYVIQTFDDEGKCLDQEFIAEDGCTWEDEYGEELHEDIEHDYFPFHMVQPESEVEK